MKFQNRLRGRPIRLHHLISSKTSAPSIVSQTKLPQIGIYISDKENSYFTENETIKIGKRRFSQTKSLSQITASKFNKKFYIFWLSPRLGDFDLQTRNQKLFTFLKQALPERTILGQLLSSKSAFFDTFLVEI